MKSCIDLGDKSTNIPLANYDEKSLVTYLWKL